MSDIKLSYIIPVFNTDSDDLVRCIRSIEIQRCSQYEIIIINDGSTMQEVEATCKRLCSENSHIEYVLQENQGAAVARNTGLSLATGTHIVFVDADDCLDENFYDNSAKFIGSTDVLCLDYTNVENQKKEIMTLGKSRDLSNQKNDLYSNVLFVPEALDNLMFGAIWAKVILKEMLDSNNIRFIPELRKTQDRVFMLQVYIAAKSIRYLPIMSYRYYRVPDSITHKMNFKMIEYYENVNNWVNKICVENSIPEECYEFFTFSILIELLKLTYFHRDYKSSFRSMREGIDDLYRRFDINYALSHIKISDFNKLISKIKFLLFKGRAYFILRSYFRLRG